MELLAHLEPRNVVLVHGEKDKMKALEAQVEQELGVKCSSPRNHEMLTIHTEPRIAVGLSSSLVSQVNRLYS